MCDGRWKWVSWVVLCADFTADFGLFTSFINNQMSLGIALRRFRDFLSQSAHGVESLLT